MCGIAGIYKFGKEPITEEMISLFLTGNEHRGNDATGIALMQEDGKVVIVKRDIPAWKFVTSEEYRSFTKENLLPTTVIALLHTRGASSGSPRVYENNHPMYMGKTAVIHNGSLRNNDHLFDNL